MATTGRTRAKKTEEAVTETVETVETGTGVEDGTPSEPAERVLKDTDKVTVMNNTTGRYGYDGKNGYSIDFDEYGDTFDIPLGELKQIMASKHKKHLKEAWIIVLDEEAVEALNLTREYKYVYTEEQVEGLLATPHKIEEVFPKMSSAMQMVIISTAKRKVANGEMNDLRVVTAIKNVAGIDILES